MADKTDILIKNYLKASNGDGTDDTGLDVCCKDYLFPYFNRYLYFKLNNLFIGNDFSTFILSNINEADLAMSLLDLKDKKEPELKKLATDFAKDVSKISLTTASEELKSELRSARKEAAVLVKNLIIGREIRPIALGTTNAKGEFVTSESLYELDKANELLTNYRLYQSGTITKSEHDDSFVPKYDENAIYNLASWFNPSKFYTLKPAQVLALLQEIADCYAERYRVTAPPIKTGKFEKTSANLITYGAYYPSLDEVRLNEDVLNRFNAAKRTGDDELPIKLLQTVIHETKHAVQMKTGMLDSLNNGRLNSGDKFDLLKKAFSRKSSQRTEFIEYLQRAEEVDARNSAMKMINELYERGCLNECLRAVTNAGTQHQLMALQAEGI